MVRHGHLRLHREQRGDQDRTEQQQRHERAAMARTQPPPRQSPHAQAVIMPESSDIRGVPARPLPLSDNRVIS